MGYDVRVRCCRPAASNGTSVGCLRAGRFSSRTGPLTASLERGFVDKYSIDFSDLPFAVTLDGDITPRSIVTTIPTLYSHQSFRSRTEARWAVFFDSMGISWDYEPEGFKLPDGRRYLPDFWLPQFERLAEVKPTIEIQRAEGKASAFATAGAMAILLLTGNPDFRAYIGARGDDRIEYSLDADMYERATQERRLWSCPGYRNPPLLSQFSERYIQAIEAARCERFGH